MRSDEYATSSKPEALIIFDSTDQNISSFAAALEDSLSTAFYCTMATSTADNEISLSNAEHTRLQNTASLVIIIGSNQPYQRVSTTQRIICITDYEKYISVGLPLSQIPQSSPLSQFDNNSNLTYTLVIDAPHEERSQIGSLQVRFSKNNEYADVLTETLLIAGNISPETKPENLFIILKNQSEIAKFPEELLTYFREACTSRSCNIILVFDSTESTYYDSRLHFTQLISRHDFRNAFPEISSSDTVIFSDYSQLFSLGFTGKNNPAIWVDNLRLISFRDSVSSDTLSELAADPSEFHKKSLDILASSISAADTRVTVIVPHYNTPLHKLTRCLESAHNFKELHQNTEILLIDDGSATDIRPDLNSALGTIVDDIRYVRTENQGLGLARQHGIDNSTGDFVYFLDSDDEVVAENLRYMLLHALATNAGLVIGKRILCNENGTLLSDSSDYIFRSVARSIAKQQVNVFDDIMVNNKLIRKDELTLNEIYFRPGFYEDNQYASHLYASLKVIEALNLPVHKWYQYSTGESITRTVSFKHINDKLTSIEDAWHYVPENARYARLLYNVNGDLPIFLNYAFELTEDQQRVIFERVRSFVFSRRKYLRESTLNQNGKQLLHALKQNDMQAAFIPHEIEPVQPTARWVFFPRTHFHILQTIAFALANSAPVVVVLEKNLPSFESDFGTRLRKTNIFADVIEIQLTVIRDTHNTRLRLGHAGTTKMLDILMSSYREQLGGLSAADTAVYFVDGLPERFYQRTHFGRLIKMEDGYGSTTREFSLGFKDGAGKGDKVRAGVFGPVSAFLEEAAKDWIPIEHSVDTMYVNKEFDRSILVGPYENANVVVNDTYEFIEANRVQFSHLLSTVYGQLPTIKTNSSIVLTQPLYFDYCTTDEHIAVVAHLIAKAKHSNVYIKPHPMDTTDYSSLPGIEVLPAKVPFECYEIFGQRAAEGLTFGSSAMARSGFFDEFTALLPDDTINVDDVKQMIQRICYDLNAMALPATKQLISQNSRATSQAFSAKTISRARALVAKHLPPAAKTSIKRVFSRARRVERAVRARIMRL